MSLASIFSAIGPDMFSRAVPVTTNTNARPAKKGKNAKSKKRRMRETQQSQAGFANQQQMQKDQFDFLQQNIFDPTGSKQKNRAARVEGMDFFDKTGPDRQSVKDRQARVDSTGLNQPGVWEGAQAAVNRQKQVQGWADANTPPPQAPSNFNQDQYMQTPGKSMDVFSNGDGTVTRSRANPYGTARSVFGPAVQGPPAPARQTSPMMPSSPQAPSAPAGPVQQLFQPPQPQVNPNNVAQGGDFIGPPNYGDPSMGPPMQPPSYTGIAGVPRIGWDDLLPKENSEGLVDMFITDPTTGISKFDWQKLQNLFTPAQPEPGAPARPLIPLGF